MKIKKVRRPWLALSLVVLIFVGVASGGYFVVSRIESTRYAAGVPKLDPALASMKAEAVSIGEMKPQEIGDSVVVLTYVETEYVRMDFTSNRGEVTVGRRVDVGTAVEISGCTVAVLETHPGPSGGKPGSQTGGALVAVECADSSGETERNGISSESPTEGGMR